jgi:hypothetical protein
VSPINEHDLGRLADYGADLLDPAEAAWVRQRIEEDPDWARAYADLAAAGPRLDAALSGLRDAPIPEQVADRLAAVLALQSPPAGTRTAKVIELSARRVWMRRSAGIATAAAVVAAIFGGVIVLRNGPVPGAATSASSGLNAGPAAGPALTIRHSGVDYTPQTLPNVDSQAQTSSKDSGNGGSTEVVPAPSLSRQQRPGVTPPAAAPPANDSAMAPLANDPALGRCLAAISAQYEGTPSLVDYAFFQGSAALIVVLDTASARVIVVVGPRCGQPGAGTDERYSRAG